MDPREALNLGFLITRLGFVFVFVFVCVPWFGLVWIDFGEVFGGVVSGEGLKVGYVHHSPVVSPARGGG